MKELSMHVLDIAQNSIKAEATNIEVYIEELKDENKFNISINDDGNGMEKNFLEEIKNPFKTSRTTRKVGLGIPMLEQTCLQCNGSLEIKSEKSVGTKIFATMEYNSIDRPPLGDIVSSIHILIITNEKTNIYYKHKINNEIFEFNSKEIREVLDDVSFMEPEISGWIKNNLLEGLSEISNY